jgi:succinyl-diaminopimelate desuccinylase
LFADPAFALREEEKMAQMKKTSDFWPRYEQPLVKYVQALCRIPTVNPPGRCYAQFVEFAEKSLREIGLRTAVLKVPEEYQRRWAPETMEYPRWNLLARWDVGASRTLHFTGHYDVVPPTAGWKSDPFSPRIIKGGKLLGRGTGDMKAALAAAVFAVRGLMENDFKPTWNIELSFTPDEETAGRCGLGWLVHAGKIRPNAAVLCEGGSGDRIGYAHRGVLWLETTVLGESAHASNPLAGVNAFVKASQLALRLHRLNRVYAGRRSGFLADAMARRPTLMVGGVSGGGTKINTIPDRFQFTMDRRLLPEEKPAQALAEIKRVIGETQREDSCLRVKLKQLAHVPPGFTDPTADICRWTKRAHQRVTGRRATFRMTGGFTDMHWLTNDLKTPTVGYGVAAGGAHSDFEYVHLPALFETMRIYAEIIRQLPPTT